MDHFTVGVGAVWIFLTIGAAAFLGTEFVLQEVRTLIKQRRDPKAE
jgi:hypothetical protein